MIYVIDWSAAAGYGRGMIKAEDVTSCALLQRIPAKRLARLLAGASVQTSRRGETLFRQGAEAKYAWLVLDGWVHLVRAPEHQDGARGVVLYTVTARDVLCGISSIEPETYTTSGIAASTARVLRLPAASFREALIGEPRFAYEVLRLCASRIRQMAEQYGAMTEPVSHRIARSILRLQRQFGQTLPVTHRELAQMSCTTTESAIRVVRHLKHQGAVAGARGRLTVVQTGALTEMLRPGIEIRRASRWTPFTA